MRERSRGAWREHPSVVRLAHIARILGPLNARVVFIGGAIAPILQSDPPFLSARATKDVDGVAATTSATDHARLQAELRARGFRESVSERHAHRWIAPDASLFDLVPAGDHFGASGQAWDQVAIDTAVRFEVESGLVIHHASAPAFLALKWAAYADRGAGDPFASHDLEDIIALIASRDAIVDEVRGAPSSVRTFVREATATLVAHRDFEELLATDLQRAFDAPATIRETALRFRQLAEAVAS